MRQTRWLWWAVQFAIATSVLGGVSRGAPAVCVGAREKPKVSHSAPVEKGEFFSEQSVAEVPLKRGVWEKSVYAGARLMDGPREDSLCADQAPPWSFFPSIFPAENFGKVRLLQIVSADRISRLEDGTYRVKGSARTARGGDIGYVHLITLHGDDAYEDVFTVSSHDETKHPVKSFYTGRGHWVRPCSVRGK